MSYVRDRKPDNLKRWVQIIAAVSSAGGIAIAAASVVVGVIEFSRTQHETEVQRMMDAEKLSQTQAIEARRPYLEQKLKWCTEVIEKTAAIAVDGKRLTLETRQRFWQLYWGVMGMIENKELELTMMTFGSAMDAGYFEKLPKLSLHVAYACRDEMAKEWSPVWSR